MALTFKITKKLSSDSDSTHIYTQSPLARLYGSPTLTQKCSRDNADKSRAGNGSSAVALRRPTRQPFADVVKQLLGISSSQGGKTSAANSSSTRSKSDQSLRGLANGWRPKRASDRLPSESTSPPQKKNSTETPWRKNISVKAGDLLADLRPQEDAGSLSSLGKRRGELTRLKSTAGKPQKKNSSCSGDKETSEDEFLSLSKAKAPAGKKSSTSPPRATGGSRQRTEPMKDAMEEQRDSWRHFRESGTKSVQRPKKPKRTEAETIVLSSEEEESEEEKKGKSEQVSTCPPAPPILTLDFSSAHIGQDELHSNGPLVITEHCITLPVRGMEEGDLVLVASQLCGYGVWDGGVAKGGALLADWEGPAPSLLFFWMTPSQASLMQRELLSIQSSEPDGPPCCFVLLVLQEQLQGIDAALLASMLDNEEYKKGRSFLSEGPESPLEWADGLLLLHTCRPPVDQHLLHLLGHSEKSTQLRGRKANQSNLVKSSIRLLQYPLAQVKGRITITTEDVACLDAGEFLNDVIIDFYLKYLLLEGVAGPMAERCHVFSSFFYKQLSRRRAAGEHHASHIIDRHTRHKRVKTWTRNEDIFTKDFIFVPVNQESHWFLVVICFPALDSITFEDYQPREDGEAEHLSLPECTQKGWTKSQVMKRPCILVMDSLKLSLHQNVCRLIRDYLQVEWEVRRKTPRIFTGDTMRNSTCRVPLQDNFSDCGVFLLQYVETFLKNPVIHFDLPLHLESWFPQHRVRQKREEIRSLITKLHRVQLRTKDS